VEAADSSAVPVINDEQGRRCSRITGRIAASISRIWAGLASSA